MYIDMKPRICEECKRRIKDRNMKAKFCSTKCNIKNASRKRRNRLSNDPNFIEYHKLKSKAWAIENRDRQNQNNLSDYYKHKDRWECRRKTRKLLMNGRIELEHNCKNGCVGEKFQIHHEVYHRRTNKIIDDVLKGKIYYLCLRCHKRCNLKVTH